MLMSKYGNIPIQKLKMNWLVLFYSGVKKNLLMMQNLCEEAL